MRIIRFTKATFNHKLYNFFKILMDEW
jgi:hypothetical protein